MWENPYKKKIYQTWQTAVKTFKQHQNVPRETHKKRQILFHRFFDEYTLFLTPLLFLKGKNKIPKKWVGGGSNFLKKLSVQKGRGEKKYRICRGNGIFSF